MKITLDIKDDKLAFFLELIQSFDDFVSIEQTERMLEELEDLEDVKLYDEAKLEDNGQGIAFSDYLVKRQSKNG